MIRISANQTLHSLIASHPPLKQVLHDIGFEEITTATMLQTVGRVMTLNKGARVRKIPIETLQSRLAGYGYHLVDTSE
jgi:hypothetical protein